MTIAVSTRFKELILGANAFVDIFAGGRILLYSGAPPSDADQPVQGTLLAQITNAGDTWLPGGSAGGLAFVQTGTFISKDPGQGWRLVAQAAGTPGWFRLVGPDEDEGLLSYTHPRIDGLVGIGSGADLRLQVSALANGQNLPVQQWLYTLPPLGT